VRNFGKHSMVQGWVVTGQVSICEEVQKVAGD